MNYNSKNISGWISWINLRYYYLNNILSKEETTKISNAQLNNISENTISKFKIYENDYFFKVY